MIAKNFVGKNVTLFFHEGVISGAIQDAKTLTGFIISTYLQFWSISHFDIKRIWKNQTFE